MNVVDANIVLKLYLTEPDSDAAQEVVDRAGPLAAPDHILGEVGEVLVRRLHGGAIDRRQLDAARIDLPRRLFLVPLEELFDQAFELALPTDVSFYDALYVAASASRLCSSPPTAGSFASSPVRPGRGMSPFSMIG